MGRTLRRGEEPLADVAVRVHRPADVEEEQNTEVRTARSAHLDLQLTRAARRRVDGAGKIELVLRSLANVGAQPPQGDLDLPRVERHVRAKLAEPAPLRERHRAPAARRSFTDADSARVLSTAPIRRGPARSHPFVAAIVAAGLLGEPLAELPSHVLEIEGFQELPLLRSQLAHRSRIGEPVEDLLRDLQRVVRDAAKIVGERAVEGVEILLAVYAERSGDAVEAVERGLVQASRQRLRERERLLRTDLQAPFPELVQEVDEHGLGARPPPAVHRLGEGEEILLALEERAEEGERLVELHALDAGAAE